MQLGVCTRGYSSFGPLVQDGIQSCIFGIFGAAISWSFITPKRKSPSEGRSEPISLTYVRTAWAERKLAALRLDDERGGARQRTSVMTHIAWVPEEWVEAAEDVLTGLADRHPSRTIVLFPQSGDGGLEGEVDVESFGRGAGRTVCTDTIRITLHGTSAAHPASVVEPLLIPDLPVFLRWRGLPPFDDSAFAELVEKIGRAHV